MKCLGLKSDRNAISPDGMRGHVLPPSSMFQKSDKEEVIETEDKPKILPFMMSPISSWKGGSIQHSSISPQSSRGRGKAPTAHGHGHGHHHSSTKRDSPAERIEEERPDSEQSDRYGTTKKHTHHTHTEKRDHGEMIYREIEDWEYIQKRFLNEPHIFMPNKFLDEEI